MMHTNYQPARRGLIDVQTQNAKRLRKKVNPQEFPWFDMDTYQANIQHHQLRYSDRGDFTRCYRGGF